MFKKILSVSGFTLLSRLTGFVRDIVLAAVLGAGALMDAFSVALRLPNHFRAIFGEGAFNQAYIPAYTRLREQRGEGEAALFSNRVFTLVLIVQVALLAVALPFMPWLVQALAPGFSADPAKFQLAVALTRITFPYLMFITLVTLLSGNLNAVDRFAAAAAAPVLLNICLVVALSIAFLFPNAAYAAAWGVALAGLLEWLLLVAAARREGVAVALVRPRLDGEVKVFLKALGPAVIGSAGVQIALFADTIIASLLPEGGYAALYYAERLYQLPIGVIAIGVGTVLLPTMTRLVAGGNVPQAHATQNRAMALTILMAAPFVAVFLVMPELIVALLFERGAFTASASKASGAVLMAYAIGLPAIVLIRGAIASFHSRGDTMTPVKISLFAIACNVALKFLLWQPLGAPGLALATAAGAWINVLALHVVARRRDWTAPDIVLSVAILAAVAGGIVLGAILWFGAPYLPGFAAQYLWGSRLAGLALLGGIGMAAYGTVIAISLKVGGVGLRLR
jgi:putative peptidoglycan lipid II flippase